MNARLGIRLRLGMIVVMALLAVWLSVVAAFYVAEGAGRAAALPTPGGLSALAKAVERTGPEDRALILTAMHTETRSVRVAPEPLLKTELPALWPADMATLDGYVRALGGRPLVVTPQEVDGLVGPRFVSAFNAVEFRVGLEGGETLIVRSRSPVVVAPIGVPVGFGAGLIGVVVALGALILLNRELRPLAELAAAMDEFEPDGDASFAPKSRARSPEIQALAAAFGRLQDRLATLTRSRMALIGGIQHDLRSFATRLRLRVDKIADADERARAEADIADMVALLDDALVASRIGADALNEELLEPLAVAAAEVEDRRAAGAEVDLSAAPEARSAVILGDRLAFRRIVANLVDNALRYGGAAHVALCVEDDDVVLTVDDDGPGISPEQRAFLFEPFTRLDMSRARATGGAGLGLAIIRSLTTAHGGAVSIEDAPSGGARLIVKTPLFQARTKVSA
ncbi:MAG: ATP-binding protein [Pseudomonadota bacterium]